MFKCFLGDCVSKENDTYVDLTTMILSRLLTIHLNDSSSIALHLKSHSIPKYKFWKTLVKNTPIIVHKINKLWLQILEALHIKNKLELIELTLKIATMFWNTFSPFFIKYSISLDNILFLLIELFFKFIWCYQHLSLIQQYVYVIFAMF